MTPERLRSTLTVRTWEREDGTARLEVATQSGRVAGEEFEGNRIYWTLALLRSLKRLRREHEQT
jgi:hypothetical protein